MFLLSLSENSVDYQQSMIYWTYLGWWLDCVETGCKSLLSLLQFLLSDNDYGEKVIKIKY